MPRSLRTLVVDDEAGIRFFLEETLRRAGYTVITASSGEDALDRLREAQEPEDRVQTMQCGPFVVDLEKHVATCDGRMLDLTPREFSLLAHLMEHVDRVVPPQELVRVVRDYDPDDLHEAREIIKWYVFRLRQKVEPDPSSPRYILNVRGVGYRFGQEPAMHSPRTAGGVHARLAVSVGPRPTAAICLPQLTPQG